MVTVLKKLNEKLELIANEDKEINAFLEVRGVDELREEAKAIDEKIAQGTAGRLAGKIIAAKANINVEGLHASCSSNTLKDYKATYDATVIEKIKAEDGLILGMLNSDEFASGSSGETSAFGPTKNPVNKELIPGGSSSGSAAAVAAGFCDMTLGSDTGGSIRNPSSHCGIVGIKPTYASVSRYGLIDLSMSLDQIGPFAKNVEECALLLDVIRGFDERDSICVESPKIDLEKEITSETRIGVLDFEIQDKRIQELLDKRIEELKNKFGCSVEKVKIEHIGLAIETYYPLVYTEFFSGTRKLDGRRYGEKIEDSCGPEVLRRILGGMEVTRSEHEGRTYHLARRVKKKIEEEYREAFKNFDVIVSPTVPILPHKIGDDISVDEMYAYDALTIPANLAGNTAMSVPMGEIEGMPVGMQIMADRFCEEKMIAVGKAVESL